MQEEKVVCGVDVRNTRGVDVRNTFPPNLRCICVYVPSTRPFQVKDREPEVVSPLCLNREAAPP